MRNTFISLIFFLIIGNELLVTVLNISFFNGTLTVTHKLTKKTVLTIHNVLISSKDSLMKVQMYLSSPLDACSKVDALPNNSNTGRLHSLTGSAVEGRYAILLVEDINCDSKYKFKNVHEGGYSGIILYSDDDDVRSIDQRYGARSLFVALISISQGHSLQKFAKNSYNLQFIRDPTLIEKLYSKTAYIVQIFYDSGRRAGSWFYQHALYSSELIWNSFLFYVLQVTVLLSPLLFLLLVIKKTTTAQPPNPDYDHYDEDYNNFFFSSNNGTSRREEKSWYWEYSHNDYESGSDDEESLRRHREILGVEIGATRYEVETEFRRKSKEFHPDKNMHLSEEEREKRTEQFKILSCAKIALLKTLEIS